MSSADVLISADSHVQVSHEAIKAHLARKYHDEYDAAADGFELQKMKGASAVNQAWTTERQRSDDDDPKRFATSTRPGYHDGAARLADMDLDGIEAEVLFSELSFFRYWGDLKGCQDQATVAFNEALREFAAADPSRLVMSYQVPIQDIEAAVAEVERLAGLGAKSLQLPVFPPELGLPDYYHERYDPLLGLIEETGLPVCCHIGLNTHLDELTARDPTPGSAIMIPMAVLSTAEALGMWIMGGVLERFTDLKLVFVEPGVGWIAWWLNWVDDMVLRQNYRLPDLRELPSHYFRRNLAITFVEERDTLSCVPIRETIGIENIMWSTDYPHPTTSFPNSRQVAAECVMPLAPHERSLVTSGNAQRIWALDARR